MSLAVDLDALDPGARPADRCIADAEALGFERVFLGRHGNPALVRAARRARLGVVGVLGPERELPGGARRPIAADLAGHDGASRARALEGIGQAAATTARLASPPPPLLLGLGPLDAPGLAGEDPGAARASAVHRALDHLLPARHVLLRARPDARFAIAIPATEAGWPRPAELETLLGELRAPALGFWYDAAAGHILARAGIAPAAEWFDRSRPRLLGASFRDAGAGETDLPLGSGEVDLREVADLLPAAVPAVMHVDARYGLAAVAESRRCLDGLMRRAH